MKRTEGSALRLEGFLKTLSGVIRAALDTPKFVDGVTKRPIRHEIVLSHSLTIHGRPVVILDPLHDRLPFVCVAVHPTQDRVIHHGVRNRTDHRVARLLQFLLQALDLLHVRRRRRRRLPKVFLQLQVLAHERFRIHAEGHVRLGQEILHRLEQHTLGNRPAEPISAARRFPRGFLLSRRFGLRGGLLEQRALRQILRGVLALHRQAESKGLRRRLPFARPSEAVDLGAEQHLGLPGTDAKLHGSHGVGALALFRGGLLLHGGRDDLRVAHLTAFVLEGHDLVRQTQPQGLQLEHLRVQSRHRLSGDASSAILRRSVIFSNVKQRHERRDRISLRGDQDADRHENPRVEHQQLLDGHRHGRARLEAPWEEINREVDRPVHLVDKEEGSRLVRTEVVAPFLQEKARSQRLHKVDPQPQQGGPDALQLVLLVRHPSAFVQVLRDQRRKHLLESRRRERLCELQLLLRRRKHHLGHEARLENLDDGRAQAGDPKRPGLVELHARMQAIHSRCAIQGDSLGEPRRIVVQQLPAPPQHRRVVREENVS
eukprot:scaffold298_cov247-Pinguiococcus_pyrenoidosus.AAC.19